MTQFACCRRRAGLISLTTILAIGSMPSHAGDIDWVARSNEYAEPAFAALARFAPESAGEYGVGGVDENVRRISADAIDERITAYEDLITRYREDASAEVDHRVRYDLQILIGSLEDTIATLTINRQHMLPYYDVAGIVFSGIRGLMDEQVADERKPAAIVRLRRYAGLEDGYQPLVDDARVMTIEAMANSALVGPYGPELDRHITVYPQYLAGIRELFEDSELDGWQEAMDAIDTQMTDYYAWVDETVQSRARPSSPLPYEVYRNNLRQYGVKMAPEDLIRLATHGFKDIQNEMTVIAGLIAEARSYESNDYRDVIRELKQEHRVAGDKALEFYGDVLASIEEIILREELVSLPVRDAGIAFASKAQSAAVPAPFMEMPRLIGNTGQYPRFMIPHLEQDEEGNWPFADTLFKDFGWSLTAHEARPGHEMQFSAMIEAGVSNIRAIFALNSANAEGWGLYAEAIMKPYFSLEAQLMSLQGRLMRAARMFLDPMVNMGMITADDVYRVISEDVVIGESLARQEVQRYTFMAPGQATSYYYGYHYLQAMRAQTEIVLADKFVQKDFHDFILAQGMLPPDLMKLAVMVNFVGPLLAEEASAVP